MSEEPVVKAGKHDRYLAPRCPLCGFRCGCCCFCDCQTPCPNPNGDGGCDCDCDYYSRHHGGHEPWDCGDWKTRYDWAKSKLPAPNTEGEGT